MSDYIASLLPVIIITYKKELVGAIFLDAMWVKTKNDV